MDKKNDVHERIESLREAVMYAPLGLLYEYDDVMPRLIRRGKSQVQIAKLVGKAASKSPNLDKSAAGIADQVSDMLAKALLEAGDLLGLTPATKPQEPDAAAATPTATPTAKPDESTAKHNETRARDSTAQPAKKNTKASKQQPSSLPIAGYDSLTAKDIVQLLGDLTPTQRATIRKHELSNRARKTILAKLDRLDS